MASINSGHTHIHKHIGTCTYLHIHIDAYEYTCIFTQAHTHSCTGTHTHTCIGTHTYIHRHTHMICAHALHTGNIQSMSMKKKSMGWGVQVNIPSCSAASAFLSANGDYGTSFVGVLVKTKERRERSKSYMVLVFHVFICPASSDSIFGENKE